MWFHHSLYHIKPKSNIESKKKYSKQEKKSRSKTRKKLNKWQNGKIRTKNTTQDKTKSVVDPQKPVLIQGGNILDGDEERHNNDLERN